LVFYGISQQKKQFPVKLTDPVTAILYITYDKQHMEELRHTIHLKEIVEGKVVHNAVQYEILNIKSKFYEMTAIVV
jgi:hypothetical protein